MGSGNIGPVSGGAGKSGSDKKQRTEFYYAPDPNKQVKKDAGGYYIEETVMIKQGVQRIHCGEVMYESPAEYGVRKKYITADTGLASRPVQAQVASASKKKKEVAYSSYEQLEKSKKKLTQKKVKTVTGQDGNGYYKVASYKEVKGSVYHGDQLYRYEPIKQYITQEEYKKIEEENRKIETENKEK